MRISTVTMFDQSVASMNRQQSDFLKVGQQIASGRRVVNPSDDPQAASRAVGVSQAMAVSQQFADARVSARNSLAQAESVLNSVSDAITSAKTLLVQASSDTLNDADRQSVASELRGIYETLIGQANASDGNGRYLFGGYQDSSPPFVRSADGVSYVGDDNARAQRVDASREMPVSDSGARIFNSVASGAGYLSEAGTLDADGTLTGSNGGNVRFSGPQVVNNADPNHGRAFRVDFTSDGVTHTYTVKMQDDNGDWVDTAPALNDEPYDPAGQTVEVGGLRLELQGTPQDGDGVKFATADEMNHDLFKTLEKALGVLENPAGTPTEKAELANTLRTTMRELDNGLDNVLTVRASMGARLNELDVIEAVGGNRMNNYEQTLSDLVDLDYSEAISEYSLRQVGLQAAQKAFVDVKGLSLFNYL
ncbi:flagellar hook-associated protein FlgL [Halomonas sp. MCCC 1A17488]|uniref:Flagellar hook-associated protein FlgL n=1 Tax=Billgrantia sulfidoxydans TaxID=2733484 RepID=A0ABX7W4Z0_9GAMM|nr:MULTISPECIES: flagellar hook-associated protein FlgL [Halomonas]MCE8014787.1 flagellar hook-associated protein FlgL [Halomonas sp. MCCC 1A17488]MCG3238120.1 flagellar hook-associated protein FlgL [Halomonas sp. MCCC 1A17488]QPP48110.1 flagellar hook-associated protein FlgL [Halomonas sp. SS10-MC5]QTP55399.1 flagellar hook-associated protein FlgL [Halomonas sulfidoxydans]